MSLFTDNKRSGKRCYDVENVTVDGEQDTEGAGMKYQCSSALINARESLRVT